MKTCTACKETKDFSCFYKQRLGRDGLASQCKQCRNSWGKEYRNTHPEKGREWARNWRKNNPRNKLAADLKFSFKITVEAYENMYRYQNGACAICQGQNTNGKRLSVDHSHVTGAIRGLLCQQCNSMLGMSKDSIERLRSAAEYLEKSQVPTNPASMRKVDQSYTSLNMLD